MSSLNRLSACGHSSGLGGVRRYRLRVSVGERKGEEVVSLPICECEMRRVGGEGERETIGEGIVVTIPEGVRGRVCRISTGGSVLEVIF